MATPRRELSYGSVQIYDKEVLGIGSYGKVCKAKCGRLPCAAKLLHQGNDAGTRNLVTKFLQECQFLSTIKHPSIVQYLGTATDPQSRRPVLLMELMDESLTRFLERLTGPLPYHSQLNICHDVALALAYLHSNGIIHRDLSSNNVLLIGEGSRAKVTDFGMSKLMDMNPRMTPLTQVPGTPAYMPPEALIASPQYSSKLDCFSHGVLTLQIITRNFPTPGNAITYMEDSRFPTGRVLVQYPETKRRKKDIDLIEPSHPLRPIALHCLKDRDTERPSADELCGRLASLKREPRYTHSVEQTRGHIQRLQDELERERAELERERAEHQRANEQLQRANGQLHIQRKHEFTVQQILEEKEEEIQRLKAIVEELKLEQLTFKNEEESAMHAPTVPGVCGVGEQPSGPIKPTWRSGQPIPVGMVSDIGAAVVHGSTAYFSACDDVYSYTVLENKWTKLPRCKINNFAMAVVKNALTTIGGWEKCRRLYRCTNTLLSLICGSSWEDLLPPMPTKRLHPAVVTIPTHLVVAGGKGTTGENMATVDVLNTETLQWSTASSLPEIISYPQIIRCGECIYLASRNNDVFQCSVEYFLKSTKSGGGGSVWTRLDNIPTPEWSSIATLRGRVLAIGGSDANGNPTRAIHCYDVATNSWSIVGKIPTPRYQVLTAVLPSNELVVVGGWGASGKRSNACDIGICSSPQLTLK